MSTSSSIGRNDTTGIRRPSRDENDSNSTPSQNTGSSSDTESSSSIRVPSNFSENSGVFGSSNSYVGSVLSGNIYFLSGNNFLPITQSQYEAYIKSQPWFSSLPDYYQNQILNNPYLSSLNAVKDGIFEVLTHKGLEKRRQAVTQINEYIASILQMHGERENTLPVTQVNDYLSGGLNPQFQNIGSSSVGSEAKVDGSASMDTSPVIEPADVLSCISSAIGAVSDLWTGAMAGYKSLMEAKNFRVDNQIKKSTLNSSRIGVFKELFRTFNGVGLLDDEQYFDKILEPLFGKKFTKEFKTFRGGYSSSDEGMTVAQDLQTGLEHSSNNFWSEDIRQYQILRQHNIESRRIESSDEGGAEYFDALAKLYDLYDKYNAEASVGQSSYEFEYYDALDGDIQGRAENATYERDAQTYEAIAALRGQLNDIIQTVKTKAQQGDAFYEVLLTSAAFASLFIEVQGLPHYGSRSTTRRGIDSKGTFVDITDKTTSFGF